MERREGESRYSRGRGAARRSYDRSRGEIGRVRRGNRCGGGGGATREERSHCLLLRKTKSFATEKNEEDERDAARLAAVGARSEKFVKLTNENVSCFLYLLSLFSFSCFFFSFFFFFYGSGQSEEI